MRKGKSIIGFFLTFDFLNIFSSFNGFLVSPSSLKVGFKGCRWCAVPIKQFFESNQYSLFDIFEALTNYFNFIRKPFSLFFIIFWYLTSHPLIQVQTSLFSPSVIKIRWVIYLSESDPACQLYQSVFSFRRKISWRNSHIPSPSLFHQAAGTRK